MRGSSTRGGKQRDEQNHFNLSFTNNAFASAILNDDESELSGENLRHEVMESIMNHEAAVNNPEAGSASPSASTMGGSRGGDGGEGPLRSSLSTYSHPASVGTSQPSRQMSQSIEMSSRRDLSRGGNSVQSQHHLPPPYHHSREQQQQEYYHQNHPNMSMDEGDNYSFRPNSEFTSGMIPPPQFAQSNRYAMAAAAASIPITETHHAPDRPFAGGGTSASARKVSFSSKASDPRMNNIHNDAAHINNNTNSKLRSHISSNNNNTNNNINHRPSRRHSNDSEHRFGSVSTSGRNSIFSTGLSSIKVQISEFDRLILQRKDSDPSMIDGNNYEVPLPQMPFESLNAIKFRIAIGFICMFSAILIAVFLGSGQFGHASASFMYHNFILKDDTYHHHHHTLNDETTKNGSHLFQKVQTLERGYKANIIGDPLKHIPSVSVDTANGDITVSVNHHEMKPDHYIEFIWIKHVETNQVVLARNFDPLDVDEAVLKAKVPDNVKLRPYLFCNRHELWIGEDFYVP